MKIMSEAEALDLRDKVVELCKRHNQWVTDSYEHKPELRMVRLEISIKVGDASRARTHR